MEILIKSPGGSTIHLNNTELEALMALAITQIDHLVQLQGHLLTTTDLANLGRWRKHALLVSDVIEY